MHPVWTFGFCIELTAKPDTRHGILYTISSVYDPFGAVSPVILTGKQILQTLFSKYYLGRSNSRESTSGENWRNELKLLETIKFQSLHTLMTEADCIVNSCPLTFENPSEPLAPNHLLRSQDPSSSTSSWQVPTYRHLLSQEMAKSPVHDQPVLATLAESVPCHPTEKTEMSKP